MGWIEDRVIGDTQPYTAERMGRMGVMVMLWCLAWFGGWAMVVLAGWLLWRWIA